MVEGSQVQGRVEGAGRGTVAPPLVSEPAGSVGPHRVFCICTSVRDNQQRKEVEQVGEEFVQLANNEVKKRDRCDRNGKLTPNSHLCRRHGQVQRGSVGLSRRDSGGDARRCGPEHGTCGEQERAVVWLGAQLQQEGMCQT